jgi:PAS domain S-box-containing protein
MAQEHAMEDPSKSLQALLEENALLKRRIEELEKSGFEHKPVDDALRASEDRYRDLVENSIDLICTHDLNGRLLSLNETAVKLFGYPRERMLRMNIQDVLTPEMRDRFDAYREEINTKGRAQGVMKIQTAAGEIRYWEYRNTLRADHPDGPVVRGMARDITDRRRMEKKLRDSEEKYRLLFEGAAEGIVIIRDEVIRFANPALVEILAHPYGVLTSRPFVEFIHPEDRSLVLERHRRRMRGDKVETGYAFRIVTGDETVKWLQIFSRVILWEGAPSMMSFITDVTERQRAEEALRESEERFKGLVEKSFAGVYVVQRGHFIFLNENAASFAGYKPEELTGRRSDSIAHPEDMDRIRARARKMLNAQDPSPYEFRIVTKDGQIRWILETVSAIQYNGIPSILGNSMDITGFKKLESEREAALEALREIRDIERGILLSVPHGLFGVENRRIFFANAAMEAVFGWKPEEMIGRSTRMIFRSDSEWEEYGAMLYAHLERQPLVVFEGDIPFVRKDGREIFCRMSVSRTGEQLGTSRRIVATFEDVTERKRAEEELHRMTTFLDLVVENIPDMIFVKDAAELRFVRFNRAGENLLGHSREDLLGKNDYDFFPKEQADFFTGNDRKVLHTKEIVDIPEETVSTRHKGARILHTKKVPILGVNGAPEYLLGISEDITDHKEAEEERKRLQMQLDQIRKLESIGTLAGGVAHDFNNLLMVIQGHISLMLLDIDASHPYYERLRRIEEQVQSGADLSRQLLGFARGGRYEAKPSDINEIVEKTAAMFGRTRKEITLHRKYEKGLRAAEVDRGQMEQVFMNLYVNAWHAMPRGGEMYLETENVHLDEASAFPNTVQPGKYVKITVTDTGMGMDAKTMERIFDPFFTTKEMGRGAGLGLATVYGIIKGHGGMIHVDSEPGYGTTFAIFLPASEKNVLKEERASGPAVSGAEGILLVDDEKMVLEVTRALLESLGYRVHAAESGPEAVAVYLEKRGEIALVILDMIMPEISGGETFDRLKKINPDVRVLLSSGYSIDGQAREILERGCRGFLQKPFRLKELSRKIREVLD